MIIRMMLTVILIALHMSYSQSVVNLNNDFSIPDSTKVPFGKKVLLKGKVDKNILSVKVNWMFGINEGSKEATLSNGSWSLVVGPFPVGESVIFQFRVSQSIPKDTLTKYVMTIFDHFSVAMAENKVSLNDDELKDYVHTKLVQSVSPHLKQIQTSAGVTLYDIILKSISGKLAKEQIVFINALWSKKYTQEEIKGILKTISGFVSGPYYDTLMINTKKSNPKDTIVLITFSETYMKQTLKEFDAESFVRVLNNSSLKMSHKSVVESIVNNISELIYNYTELKKSDSTIQSVYQTIVGNTVNELQLISEYSSSFESSITVSDIEYYAGFDVGYFIISDQNIYPFFTINIYPKKVEVNTDPHGCEERLSLSTGFALKAADIPSNGPVYLLGIGFRINKLFRITAGSAFYQDVNTKKIKGEYTAGLSLNFRYITDLLQIANGATANFQSE